MKLLLLVCRIEQRWKATRAADKVLLESGTIRYRSFIVLYFCFLEENGQPSVKRCDGNLLLKLSSHGASGRS